jgi:hypothetical protein
MPATSVTSLTRPLPVPHRADDGDVGRHPEEARHEAPQVDLRSARAGRVCMLSTFGSGAPAPMQVSARRA